jgi:RNA polymerase sigma-70 factor, ECF subfamily
MITAASEVGLMRLEELYREYAQDVYRFALHLCGEPADAEDITADTFMRAWTAREPVRTATARAYLFRIARNLYLQRLRTPSSVAGGYKRVHDHRPNPHRRVEIAEEFETAMRRLQLLSEPERTALLMSAVDGIPYEDIARTLGCSLAAVKVRIHRARLKLCDPAGR